MLKNNTAIKTYIVLDFGPSTIIVISEIILIILKMMKYVDYSWQLVLSPIILVIVGATFVLLLTLIKIIKDNLF
jgi:hypothetical protein